MHADGGGGARQKVAARDIEEDVLDVKLQLQPVVHQADLVVQHGDQYIDLVPRKGALVRQVTVQELAGMYQTRLMVEGSVIKLVCRERITISPEIAATIEKMRNGRDVETPDGQLAFIGLDWHLHCWIVEMCGNDVIIKMHKSLRSHYDRLA